MSKLVIVESPAKAKTISSFLGKGYVVKASFGHVRDLPEKATEIPAAIKKEKWANLGVNVEKDFEPVYVVPSGKKRHVDELKAETKGATELLLATDEDREGESISWHILQLIDPKNKLPSSRIVFHEITPEAIKAALESPRPIDVDLVRAQETRRILDRLYGYSLSPLLWRKVAPRLSAGRVQSVAVRLTVIRERERKAFVSAEYWDLVAGLGAKAGNFDARLSHINNKRIATGKSFDPTTGDLKDKSVLISAERAAELKTAAEKATDWRVLDIETTPGVENPPVPFMTSTLQQEANRKLRMPSKRTMQVAQTLYEGVDIGHGDRVGLITYMRTDSLNLAERAVNQCRDVVRELYGMEYLPAKPPKYKTKAKGAQEAHEAIRPSDLSRRPADMRKFLDDAQFALYELIWKRTVASQMVPARVFRTQIEVGVTTSAGEALTLGASGKSIEFPGFLRAYVEGSDDPEAEMEGKEKILPEVKKGENLALRELGTESHTTRPPARYTEASLVKKLEEEGIGRPSTYASIISTIQDRGYVTKKGNELIPTFTAFAVIQLLEQNFEDLVSLKFTAELEDELDKIAEGKLEWKKQLKLFYHGTPEHAGLDPVIQAKQSEIPYPLIEVGTAPDGEPIVVRVGRFGYFLQKGPSEPTNKNTANIPAELAPAELTVEVALRLLDGKNSALTPIAQDESGRNVFYKTGRFGSYLEVEQTEDEIDKKVKPSRVTIPDTMKLDELTEADFQKLLRLPLEIGKHPDTKESIAAGIGRFGAYLKMGSEYRNFDTLDAAMGITLDEAVALFAMPKPRRGAQAGGTATATTGAIKEFTQEEGAPTRIRVLEGRFGPYVTDGKTNATIPKATDPAEITLEEALHLIKEREGKPKSKFKRGRRK